MSEQTVKEVATIRDFSGMTAEEISKYIDENGLRGDDLADINAELEEEEAREEAKYKEAIKTDWRKFRCHAAELEMSIPISDANSYSGELYTRSRCENDARSMLHRLYKEAEDELNHDKLYQAAMEEITSYVTEHFRDRPDIGRVLDDIREKLSKVKITGLKDFSTYHRLVTYDNFGGDPDYEGVAGIIAGFFSSATKIWSFSCRDAYREIDRDFGRSAREFARAATDITIAALEKYIRETEERDQ